MIVNANEQCYLMYYVHSALELTAKIQEGPLMANFIQLLLASK